MLKKISSYILIIALFSFWGIIITNRDSFRETFQEIFHINRPCSDPIKYSIGDVDPRFGLSEDMMASVALEAEKIWESPVNKELFQYDPDAQFKINMVFDDRQQRTVESQKLENRLGTLELSHEAIIDEFNSLSSAYKKRMDDYNKAAKEYEKDLGKYNSDVSYWNSHGGAPDDVFDSLKKKKKELENDYSDLEKERAAINKLIGKSNALAQKEEDLVNTYNGSITTYKNQYGEASQFDKGVFDGSKIDIFQYKEISDLRLTLAHEFGHALGIDHMQNPESLMYYLMGEQDMNNPHISQEDTSALETVCHIQR